MEYMSVMRRNSGIMMIEIAAMIFGKVGVVNR